MKTLLSLLPIVLASCGVSQEAVSGKTPTPSSLDVLVASLPTDAVPSDADDPAIWIHPEDPTKSLILGTDKVGKTGGIYAFSLEGKIVQAVTLVDRPNNVDVEYGFRLSGETVDLAVATERGAKALRILAVARASGRMTDVTGETKVFADREGEEAAPMGIGLYRRSSDGSVFAIVGSKTGPKEGYLHQYRLVESSGRVDLQFVRSFGRFSGDGEIEAIVVDDALGYVYCADEGAGIRKYNADPNAKDASKELALFATSGYEGDREGLAVYETGPGKGFILSSDQIKGGSKLKVYRREGDAGSAHSHSLIAEVPIDADSTDGVEATSAPLGGSFPRGLAVAMNSKGRNFHIYNAERILDRIGAAARRAVSASPIGPAPFAPTKEGQP